MASLVEWLGAPEQADLRRAFVVWLKRVLLPARVPSADIPNVIEADLESWTDRVQDARVLEDVFQTRS